MRTRSGYAQLVRAIVAVIEARRSVQNIGMQTGSTCADVAGTFERKPIGMTGIDNHFIITAVIVGLSTILFIIAIRKLLVLKRIL